MRTNTYKILLLAISILSPTFAFASDITVSINRGARDDVFIDVASDKILTSLQANRSYSCTILNREYDSAIPKKFPIFSTTVTAPDMSTFSATAVGTMKPGIAVPANLSSVQDKLRISFIPTQSGVHTFTTTDGQMTGTAVPTSTVRCNDTTLYGGYNRHFADNAIVELSNDSFSNIQAFITIVDFSGNVLVDKQAVTVRANNRDDFVFASLPAATFGQIIVTYVGSLGALSGYVSEYDFDGVNLTLKRERPMDLTPILP